MPLSARLETRAKESMELARRMVPHPCKPQCKVKAIPLPDGVNCMGTPGSKSIGQGSECLQGPWDPKGGELYRPTVKPWETVVEAGRCSDVQIV